MIFYLLMSYSETYPYRKWSLDKIQDKKIWNLFEASIFIADTPLLAELNVYIIKIVK